MALSGPGPTRADRATIRLSSKGFLQTVLYFLIQPKFSTSSIMCTSSKLSPSVSEMEQINTKKKCIRLLSWKAAKYLQSCSNAINTLALLCLINNCTPVPKHICRHSNNHKSLRGMSCWCSYFLQFMFTKNLRHTTNCINGHQSLSIDSCASETYHTQYNPLAVHTVLRFLTPYCSREVDAGGYLEGWKDPLVLTNESSFNFLVGGFKLKGGMFSFVLCVL